MRVKYLVVSPDGQLMAPVADPYTRSTFHELLDAQVLEEISVTPSLSLWVDSNARKTQKINHPAQYLLIVLSNGETSRTFHGPVIFAGKYLKHVVDVSAADHSRIANLLTELES